MNNMYFQEPPARTNKRIAEINVVPYIDVLLVLLIIFMVTIPLMNQSVSINLPKASTKLTDQIKSIPVILSIDNERKLSLNVHKDNKEYLTADEVVQIVAAHLKIATERKEVKSIMIRGDGAVDYQSILHGIMLLKEAGAPNVGLMTKPESKG